MAGRVVRGLRGCVRWVRSVFSNDGTQERVDKAHGENFGKAPHGSGQM